MLAVSTETRKSRGFRTGQAINKELICCFVDFSTNPKTWENTPPILHLSVLVSQTLLSLLYSTHQTPTTIPYFPVSTIETLWEHISIYINTTKRCPPKRATSIRVFFLIRQTKWEWQTCSVKYLLTTKESLVSLLRVVNTSVSPRYFFDPQKKRKTPNFPSIFCKIFVWFSGTAEGLAAVRQWLRNVTTMLTPVTTNKQTNKTENLPNTLWCYYIFTWWNI